MGHHNPPRYKEIAPRFKEGALMRYCGPTNGVVVLTDAEQVMEAEIFQIKPGMLMIYINTVQTSGPGYFTENNLPFEPLLPLAPSLTKNYWQTLLHAGVLAAAKTHGIEESQEEIVVFHRFLYEDKIIRVVDDFMKATDFCPAYPQTIT